MLIFGQRNGLAFGGYRQFLGPADTGGGGGIPATDDDIDKLDVDDKEKTRLKTERTTARKAIADAEAAQTQLADLQRKVDDLTAAEQKRINDAATQAEKDREKAGEHEALAREREQQRDKAVADLAELQKRYDALHKVALDNTQAQFDAMPEEVREMYPGEAGDPVAMIQFMDRSKKLIERLTAETKQEENTQDVNGNPVPPKNTDSNSAAKTDDENARKQFRAGYS